jgi:hypothetical protein
MGLAAAIVDELQKDIATPERRIGLHISATA